MVLILWSEIMILNLEMEATWLGLINFSEVDSNVMCENYLIKYSQMLLPNINLYAPPQTIIAIATSFAAVKIFWTLVAKFTL